MTGSSCSGRHREDDMEFFSASRPLVFAHRGGAALAPENTLRAFDNGLALGADGLELDVRLSRDGLVVVHHDALLDRTTNLQGPIADKPAADLSRADAGYLFRRHTEYPFRGQGIGVPTLAEVLNRYQQARIIIELKLNRSDLARATIDTVRAARATDRVCLGSFGWRGVRGAPIIDPTIAPSA